MGTFFSCSNTIDEKSTRGVEGLNRQVLLEQRIKDLLLTQ